MEAQSSAMFSSVLGLKQRIELLQIKMKEDGTEVSQQKTSQLISERVMTLGEDVLKKRSVVLNTNLGLSIFVETSSEKLFALLASLMFLSKDYNKSFICT